MYFQRIVPWVILSGGTDYWLRSDRTIPQRVIDVVTKLRKLTHGVWVKLLTGFPDVEGLLKVAPLVDAIAVTLASPEDNTAFRAARLGFRELRCIARMEGYATTPPPEKTLRAAYFPSIWRLVDMAKEGDHLLESTAWVMKYANGTLFN